MKRTHLPLNGLRVLDAAARHLSFTRAADELAVTPAAVGQQIRALEEMLGLVIFRRTPRGLELTPEGAAGLEALRRGFLEFEEAVRAMQAGQSSTVLSIAAPRDVLATWLPRRLTEYLAANPGLRVDLHTADGPLDFTEANLDLAIRRGAGPGEHEGVPLGGGSLVGVVRPDDTGKAPTIVWPGWAGDNVGASALTVADAGLALDAVLAGLGRSCVPRLIAHAALTDGRVVTWGPERPGDDYWLIAPLPQWRQKKVRALVGALTAAPTV